MNKVTQKWFQTGLLNKLSENSAEKCAQFLENTAAFLVQNEIEKDDLCLPVCRRIFSKLIEYFGEDNLFVSCLPVFLDEKYNEHILIETFYLNVITLDKIKKIGEDMTAYNGGDCLPELCQVIADKIVYDLTNTDKKRIVLYVLCIVKEKAHIRMSYMKE